MLVCLLYDFQSCVADIWYCVIEGNWTIKGRFLCWPFSTTWRFLKTDGQWMMIYCLNLLLVMSGRTDHIFACASPFLQICAWGQRGKRNRVGGYTMISVQINRPFLGVTYGLLSSVTSAANWPHFLSDTSSSPGFIANSSLYFLISSLTSVIVAGDCKP